MMYGDEDANQEQEHRLYAQQLAALRNILEESEQLVPSTAERILASVRHEARTARNSRANDRSSHEELLPESQFGQLYPLSLPERRQQQSVHLIRTRIVNIFSLVAVVVIVLAAVILFRLRTSSVAFQYTQAWGSVVIGQLQQGRTLIVNYDLLNGKSMSLISSSLPANTIIDSISPDGHNLLYHYSSDGHTYYSTLSPLPKTGSFYDLNDEAVGKAMWMSDNQHVLIATNHQGILKVDSKNGAKSIVVSSASAGNVDQLWFYRDNYLYYSDLKNGVAHDLWRVNITTGAVQQVTNTFRGQSYFLSPDGTTIFYSDILAQTGLSRTAIYLVKINVSVVDVTHRQELLPTNAMPIGFAADNALVLLQYIGGRFQVVKLKPTQPEIASPPLFMDAAPGAIGLCDNMSTGFAPICDENVAFAPSGDGLVVSGLYADGSHKLWVDDFATGNSHLLQTLGSNAPHVQLAGWDRIQVPM